MPQFMLLLRLPEESTLDVSPTDLDDLVPKIQAWHEKVRNTGAVAHNGKLKNGEGRTLRRTGPDTLVFDGPFSETKEVLGGYFVVEAADYQAAVALAEGCPVLALGGSVEVRAVDTEYKPGAAFTTTETSLP